MNEYRKHSRRTRTDWSRTEKEIKQQKGIITGNVKESEKREPSSFWRTSGSFTIDNREQEHPIIWIMAKCAAESGKDWTSDWRPTSIIDRLSRLDG